MIYEILTEIAEELNQHFKLRFGLSEDKLFLSNVMNNDGSDPIEKDSVILSLVNIQEEKKLLNRGNPSDNNSVLLNVVILFTTTFTGNRYPEGLKFISEVIGFFQQNKYLEIEGQRIAFELFNIELADQNSLWASMGAKYNTAVAYKAGLIEIDENTDPGDYVPAQDFDDNTSVPETDDNRQLGDYIPDQDADDNSSEPE